MRPQTRGPWPFSKVQGCRTSRTVVEARRGHIGSRRESGPMESFPLARSRSSNAIVKNTFLFFPDEAEAASPPLRKCASEPDWLPLFPQSSSAAAIAAQAGVWQKSDPEPLKQGVLAQTGVVDGQDKWQAHINGACRPCRFFTMHVDSCSRGAACSFCHLCSFDSALACKKKDKHMARKTRRQRRQGQLGT